VIEIPWVLARLATGRVLEVGHAHAELAYLAALVAEQPGELVGVDLAEADIPGMDTVCADVRELPFDDRSFDQVLLVSTLEHVGADNSVYGLDLEVDTPGPLTALRELRRVLHPRGSLIVTVPLGEPGDHGWFRQDDINGWTRLFVRAGLFVEEQEAYELLDEGWRSAPTFRPDGVRYGERGPGASAVLCADLSPRRLRRLASPGGMRRTARRRLGPMYRRIRPIDDP
jgi:SAM-dependent methyltransferase